MAPTPKYSAEFLELRRMQSILNAFLWSSDISYRFLIASAASGDARLTHPNQKTSEALSSIQARAWYLTVEGLPHYRKTVSGLLKDAALNETHVYRGIIVQWHAAFEYFLDRRMRPYLGKMRNCGPGQPDTLLLSPAATCEKASTTQHRFAGRSCPAFEK